MTRFQQGIILSLVTIIFLGVMALVVSRAEGFEIDLEDGATFDGGICWEADGTQGISTADGQCMTPADYDEIYSFDNLSTVEILTSAESDLAGKSIAEAYGIGPEPAASDRPLGDGVTAEPFTFKEYVQAAHMPVAD